MLSKVMYVFLSNQRSDAKCMMQDVVSPHCDQRMPRRCTRRSLTKYLLMTSYHWNVRENTVTWHRWMNDTMKITWRHARNLISLRILYTFYFNPCYLFKIHFYWYSVFVVVKSSSQIFIIIWLYISFTDEHLSITNKEQRYHYSVYNGTHSYLPLQHLFLVGFVLLDL